MARSNFFPFCILRSRRNESELVEYPLQKNPSSPFSSSVCGIIAISDDVFQEGAVNEKDDQLKKGN